MQELDDQALLREYAERDSASAFAEIVSRHVDKVYSCALRHTRNPHSAEGITQAVFVILAQKAGKLSRNVILAGWLYQTARLTAITFLRGEIRRARREQEAFMQSSLDESDLSRRSGAEADAWPHIAPLLDDALARLSEKDRHAVVLRFFDDLSLKEVGAALGGSEDAAKVRVARALEKLRKFFAKRGVALTAAAIAGAVSANSVHAAPIGLTKAISSVAVAKGAASTSTLTLIKETLKIMTWKKIKLAATVAVAVLTASVVAVAARQETSGNAKIPYKMLDDANQIIGSVNQSNLELRMTFSSHLVSVATNIHLTIQSVERGPIPVQLANDGQLLNFPHDEELHRENPFIVSDLPKGSLNAKFWMRLPQPPGTNFSYRRLEMGIIEVNKAIARAKELPLWSYARHMFPLKHPVDGVVFLFPQSLHGKARVWVNSTTGRREYAADSHGRIKLKLDKSLQAENPEVWVSHKSYLIVPDIE